MSNEDLAHIALQILDEEIATFGSRPAERSELFSPENVQKMFCPSERESFATGVRAVLRHATRAARQFHDDDVTGWLFAVKPLLRVVVGWDAITPLGRAANHQGYERLHAFWEAAWDREQERRSPNPGA